MKDITELQRRLTAALERIGSGLEVLDRPQDTAPADGPTIEDLQSELESEREVTAQLEERVRAIKVKQETRLAGLERDLAEARRALETLEPDRQRLKEVNGTLRDVNRALREANAAGLADAELVNVAMAAELEALRAARESDRAEIDTILGALAPLVAEDKEATADA